MAGFGRFRRTLVGLGLAVALVTLAATSALAVDSPLGDQAGPWPTTWRAYLLADGSQVHDVIGDVGCGAGYCDVSSGGTGNWSSVYFTSDGTNAFFRLRMLADPRSSAGGFHSTTWAVQIAVNGVARATVGLDGKNPQRDFVYVANADGSSYAELYATPFTNGGGANSAAARGVADGTGHWFLDWQVPLSRITQWSGGAITGSTPVQLFFGTSQSANLAVLNKDFMIGNSVNFGPTSTVTLVPPPAAPGGGGPGGGPPVTEIPDTNMPPAAAAPYPVWLLAVPLVLSALLALSRRRVPA